MPKPFQRARGLKRRSLSLPSGGGLTVHFKKRKARCSRCKQCGRVISGVSMKSSSELSRLPATEKRPERMFGGQLCHVCLLEALKHAARSTAPS